MNWFLKVENIYREIVNYTFFLINPIKKIFIKTDAIVHQYINEEAIKLLKKYNYIEEYNLYNKYLQRINQGSVWADQDFKSASHFFNPKHRRGMFGQDDSLKVVTDYYNIAICAWKNNNIDKSMFYLGACCHIIQDLTIPNHVTIKLLDSHKKYEKFVRLTYDIVEAYRVNKPPIVFYDIGDYAIYNSRKALSLYKRYEYETNQKIKFYNWTKYNLPLSQRTTAGVMIMFLNKVNEIDCL